MAAKRTRRRQRLPTVWRVPDDLWKRIAQLLPIEEFRPTGGRRWIPPRRILDGIVYVLRTGCQWKAVPAEYGSGSTVHRRFQRWVELGCFEAIWQRLLQHYDDEIGLQWRWQSADASLQKAPLGGEKKPAPIPPIAPRAARSGTISPTAPASRSPLPSLRRTGPTRKPSPPCSTPAWCGRRPRSSSISVWTRATTTLMPSGRCAAVATSRIFGAVAKNAGHVAAGAGRAAGWSNG